MIKNWFDSLREYLKEERAEILLQDKRRIYNLDKTAVKTFRPKTGKLLVKKFKVKHIIG